MPLPRMSNEQEKQLEDSEFRHKQRRHFRNVSTFARFSCRDITMAGELGLAELTSSSLPPDLNGKRFYL